MRKLNRQECSAVPQAPGVYRLYDRNKKMFYSGRSQKLRHRISAWYQKDKSRKGWKRTLAKRVVYFSYTLTNGKRESMKKEKAYIKKHKPKFNHYSKR